jgi:hypothetical protein
LTSIEETNKLSQGAGPAFFGVCDMDSGFRFFEVFIDRRQLVDVALFYREADPRPTHEDKHSLVEGAWRVNGHIGTVVASHIVTLEGRARCHESPHRRHYLEVDNLLTQLNVGLLGNMLTKKPEVAINYFGPGLSSVLIIQPATVAGGSNKSLVVVNGLSPS